MSNDGVRDRVAEAEVVDIGEARDRRGGGGPGDEAAQAPAFSDLALAEQFAEEYAEDLRYVAAWNRWLRWDGARWQFDDTLSAYDLARAVCKEIAAGCDTKSTAKSVASAATVAAVERLARADRQLATTIDTWDQDPWILNTPGGTVNLRTGDLQPACRESYATKITAVTPEGPCNLWDTFLSRITGGDNELKMFLQRMAGYCVSGVTREHALFFLYGTGANGKSVFINTLAGVLGDYAQSAPVDLLMASNFERHPAELAVLRGARLVSAVETESGRRWAEAKVKTLTGGDRISARFMRQDPFEFTPQFKLVLCGNHKPGLRSVDEAICETACNSDPC
jgi:putative DNA primase/helicase